MYNPLKPLRSLCLVMLLLRCAQAAIAAAIVLLQAPLVQWFMPGTALQEGQSRIFPVFTLGLQAVTLGAFVLFYVLFIKESATPTLKNGAPVFAVVFVALAFFPLTNLVLHNMEARMYEAGATGQLLQYIALKNLLNIAEYFGTASLLCLFASACLLLYYNWWARRQPGYGDNIAANKKMT